MKWNWFDFWFWFYIITVTFTYYSAYYSSKRIKHKEWLRGHFAHRGLYDRSQTIPENSLAAFQKAVENGYGIELDIQMSQDGKVYVFHDDDLTRMTGVNGLLEERSDDQLKSLRLANTQEPIPLLSEVLSLVKGSVPLLIEFKTTQRRTQVVRQTLDLIKDYPGEFAFCSFDPLILLELKKQDPTQIRGLNMEYSLNKKQYALFQRLVLHFGFLNFLIKPDYLSIDYLFVSMTYQFNRMLFKSFGMKWAIPTQAIEDQLIGSCETVIFEHYLP